RRELKANLLPNPDKEVVDVFADAKVLALRGVGADQTVAITDEPLITGWRRLSDWIEIEREFLIWRDGLDAALANWEKLNRHKSALRRGVPLKEAQERPDNRRADLNAAETEYINVSIAAESRSHTI